MEFFFLSLSTIRLFVHSLASEFWAVTRSDFCIETTNRIQCDTLFVLLLLIWLERFVYKHGEQSFDCAFERPCSYHSDIPVVIDSFSLARYLPYVFMSSSSTNNNRANWTKKFVINQNDVRGHSHIWSLLLQLLLLLPFADITQNRIYTIHIHKFIEAHIERRMLKMPCGARYGLD